MLRSAAKNYRSVTVITDPADYAVVAGEIAAQGRHHPGHPRTARRESLPHHRLLRRAHRQLSRRQRLPEPEPFPGDLRAAAAPRAGAPLRRKSAPGRRALRPVPAPLPAAPRQGTFLQQSHRHQRRRAPHPRVHRRDADRRHPQAHQPVRPRQRRHPRRSVGQGLRHRPAGALRRHHRRQPPARPRRRAAHRGNFQRSHHRARLSSPTRWPSSPKRRTCA